MPSTIDKQKKKKEDASNKQRKKKDETQSNKHRGKKNAPPSKKHPLEKKLKKAELKSLLKKKGLPCGGNVPELVERLQRYPNGYGPKGPPKKWQYSEAKLKLKKDLLDKNSPIHKMSVKSIWDDPAYKMYPMFPNYYHALKNKVESEQKEAHLDDIKAKRHINNNPRKTMNKRGYPHWDGHPAEKLLEVDVCRKLHLSMKPSELHKTRKEYEQFPVHIFAVRVNREVMKQRAAKFWAYKRNKEGMKKYLNEIEERAYS